MLPNCMSGKRALTLKYDSAQLCPSQIFTVCYMLLFGVLSPEIYDSIIESLYIITVFFSLNNCCGKTGQRTACPAV